MVDATTKNAKTSGAAVEGDVVRVTFENAATGFRVLRVDVGRTEPLTVVGVFPSTPAGARIRATGRYEASPKHGDQFRAGGLIQRRPALKLGHVAAADDAPPNCVDHSFAAES